MMMEERYINLKQVGQRFLKKDKVDSGGGNAIQIVLKLLKIIINIIIRILIVIQQWVGNCRNLVEMQRDYSWGSLHYIYFLSSQAAIAWVRG